MDSGGDSAVKGDRVVGGGAIGDCRVSETLR